MMTNKIDIHTLPKFDMADVLKTEEDIAIYLNDVLSEDDPAELTHALGVIAKARGMSNLAKQTGLGRESLYKTLSYDSNPQFATIRKVLHAMGLKLQVAPI